MQRGSAVHVVGALLALLAGAWHTLLITSATNDNFFHMTLAQQVRAGEWPVRDFFDDGRALQYMLSAAAQMVLGDRMVAEGLIVGVAWAVSTYLIFLLVRQLTGSTMAAGCAALLLILAGARGYSYPKGIVFAVAVMLWWAYVLAPSTARIVILGAWTAAAFYWRPDYGLFVGCAIVLAVIVAHGFRRATFVRGSLAGLTTLALVAPFLLYVQVVASLPAYVHAGLVAAQAEHARHGVHQWPLLRFGNGVFDIEPADRFTPTIGLRWRPDSSLESRREMLARYDLTPLPSDDGSSQRVKLSERGLENLRAILNESIVDDTAGIDQSTATLPSSTWPAWDRWSFRIALLRLRVLPSLDGHTRASEIVVVLFFALPIVLAAAAPWLVRSLPGAGSAGRLAAFAAFAFLVDLAMLRSPFPARAPDAVVLSAVVFGCCLGAIWNTAAAGKAPWRVLLRGVAVALTVFVVWNVATVGRFGERISGLAGQWSSRERARAAWTEVYRELGASPPLSHFYTRRAGVSIRLAAYVRECVPPSERLLVLWFAPDIYYYSGRLMAQRHLVLHPGMVVARGRAAEHARQGPPFCPACRPRTTLDPGPRREGQLPGGRQLRRAGVRRGGERRRRWRGVSGAGETGPPACPSIR